MINFVENCKQPMRNLFLILLIFISSHLSAQTWIMDSVSQDANYQMDCYYSLLNEKQTQTNTNTTWDLGFYVNASSQNSFSASVRANHSQPGFGVGMQVYSLHQPASYWDSVSTSDTAGLHVALWNSEVTYDDGAFNQNKDESNPFSFGWGVYNSSNHNLYGDSIYVINKSGVLYKFIVDSLNGSTSSWYFRIAKMDGTDEESVSLNDAGQYSTKLYAYYDIETNTILDREPAIGDWELNFSKYAPEITYAGQTIHYPIQGVLGNRNVKIARLENMIPDSQNQSNLDYSLFENNYSNIGWKWRKPGTNDTIGNLSYLVKPVADTNKIYQVVFNSIGGSQTGMVHFMYRSFDNVESVKNPNKSISEFTLFPNPSSNKEIFLQLENQKSMDGQIQIMDITGKVIWSQSKRLNEGTQALQIELDSAIPGTYILSILAENTVQMSSTFTLL